MEFQIISELLNKFKHLAATQEAIKKEAEAAINKKTGITIENSSIRINKNIIVVEGGSALKSAIFMRKGEILDELKKTLGKNTPKDIR